MDIEDLTKTQLLLLTILVNFILSIATGVLVISMLDQSPAPITQTVQQIVDHTIETISTPISSPIVITKPSPTTPTQEQQLTAAVAADNARTVLIYKNSTSTPALAYGVYLPKSRAVATSASAPLPKEALIAFADGSTVEASLSKQGTGITIYGFADAAILPTAPAANPVAAADLKQGQTIVALTKDRAAIIGIISKVDATGITTNLAGVPAGAGVVDLSGNVIGIGSPSGILLPTDRIMAVLESVSP
ncbi:MAG: hypothetical protein AB203_00120 [Parcubacteria bacterium C7867-008]|nr:MAG: hypothetical protein AB203_00120 [Parcubacteria bacterium C7867-008]